MFFVYLHSSLFTITKFAYRNRQPSWGTFPLAVFLCVELNIEINKNMLNGRSFNPSKASRIPMCRWFRYFLP